ncbi:MAG: hypothetical protein LBD23_06110 [Oscillospiraceae bacterium]|jgi:hypothetical protein|nr:hypothetical protein [Oscillospiraceae bacterium]
MMLFFQEIKKIFRPLTLLMLVLFVGVYGGLYNGWFSSRGTTHQVFSELINIMGSKLDSTKPDLFRETVTAIEVRYISKFNEEIGGNPFFEKAHITDYQSYITLISKNTYSNVEQWVIDEFGVDYVNQHYRRRHFPPFDPEADYSLTPAEEDFFNSLALWQIEANRILMDIEYQLFGYSDFRLDLIDNMFNDPQAFDDYVAEVVDRNFAWHGVASDGIDRIREIYYSDDILYMVPELRIDAALYHLTVLILGSLFILVAPVVTRDNMSGVRSLQYSSKTGRKVLTIQFIAVIVSALVVTIAIVGGLLYLYLTTVLHPFLGSGLHSIFKPNMFNWFTGTFLQFYILVGLMLIGFALAITVFLFVISKISKNYITMLLITIPLIVLLFNLAMPLFRYPFAIFTADGFTFYRMIPVPFIEAYILIALFLVAVIPSGLLLMKQKREEIT